MLTRTNKIICDNCGKFISYEHLMSSEAKHSLVTPDSDLTKETWESLCPKCFKLDNQKKPS